LVLPACETSYARGLKQMHIAADYSLHQCCHRLLCKNHQIHKKIH